MLWVNSRDLKDWAERRDCQGDLPFLLRSLIRATATDISKIFFQLEIMFPVLVGMEFLKFRKAMNIFLKDFPYGKWDVIGT